ncbi:MAG: hypothetical protein ACYC9Z_07770 [Casimicrobiaceae bacterium]
MMAPPAPGHLALGPLNPGMPSEVPDALPTCYRNVEQISPR